jgi:hypothetical protein
MSTIGGIGLACDIGGAGILGANPLGFPIGCQTWPVRQTIGKDLDGTLKELAGWGFERIEMCSPAGYARFGFGPLAQMQPAALRERIHAAGLGCASCHFGFTELRDHLDERLAFAKELGLRQMIIATFGVPKDAKMTDWMHAVDEANKLGERTQKEGIQLGFHNHDFEFQKIDGELIYDKLMGVRPEIRKDAVPGERDQPGLSGGGLLREVSGPVHFDPPARLVANGEERGRTGAGRG